MLRRLLSLGLAAALVLMNVQAAELHVHATAGHPDDAHHHGPASHHHDDDDHPSESAEVTGVDAADTVVHVALVAAGAQPVKTLHVSTDNALMLDPGVSSIVDDARIVARAHGPPSIAPPSLRAPPAPPAL